MAGSEGAVARMIAVAVSSLYDWAGGEAAFVRLIDAFYDRVEADDLLSPLFPGGVTEEHRSHVMTASLPTGRS